MNRLFILEGVDSSGKSTLAKTLVEMHDAMYLHASGHRDLYGSMQAHHMNLLECAAMNLKHRSVVIDRLWPSEYVYTKVTRPQHANKYDYFQVSGWCSQLSATYVFCHPDDIIAAYDRYVQSHATHDKNNFRFLSKEEYYAIAGEYRVVFEYTPHVKYVLEIHGRDVKKFCEEL